MFTKLIMLLGHCVKWKFKQNAVILNLRNACFNPKCDIQAIQKGILPVCLVWCQVERVSV